MCRRLNLWFNRKEFWIQDWKITSKNWLVAQFTYSLKKQIDPYSISRITLQNEQIWLDQETWEKKMGWKKRGVGQYSVLSQN